MLPGIMPISLFFFLYIFWCQLAPRCCNTFCPRPKRLPSASVDSFQNPNEYKNFCGCGKSWASVEAIWKINYHTQVTPTVPPSPLSPFSVLFFSQPIVPLASPLFVASCLALISRNDNWPTFYLMSPFIRQPQQVVGQEMRRKTAVGRGKRRGEGEEHIKPQRHLADERTVVKFEQILFTIFCSKIIHWNIICVV